MQHRILLASAAVTAALVASSGTVDAASSGKQISLHNIAFNPSTLKIKAGTSVTWTWKDPYVTHNIHSIGKPAFKGASDRQSGTYTFVFKKKGTYRYQCTLHPGMKAKIVVS